MVLLPGWLFASGAACWPDVVADGYYGPPEDAGNGTESSSPAAAAQPADTSQPANTSQPAWDGDAQATAREASGPPSMTTACDLTGRWLATERQVATALGAQEANHTFYYLEISQTGSQATVTKGLDCGGDIRGISAVAANSDYPKTWPALLTHVTQTGRTATSVATSSGCSIAFESRYMVMGATVAYYEDPSTSLPTTSQQATASSPGWEDWDQDGNPGYTVTVTGFITGQVYLATRTASAWSGNVQAGARTFKLADKWNTEQALLGYSGSSLLTAATSATPDNNASLHFVQFANLDSTQATGDAATTCAAVRSLAATLTPDAAN
jgi:hypothetical protein